MAKLFDGPDGTTEETEGGGIWRSPFYRWAGGVIAVLVVFAIIRALGGDAPPYEEPRPANVIGFVVEREWKLPHGGFGADLSVGDAVTKEQVLRLSQWLLQGSGDVLIHIDNPNGRLAIARRLFEDDGGGSISWFDRGALVAVYGPGGNLIESHR